MNRKRYGLIVILLGIIASRIWSMDLSADGVARMERSFFSRTFGVAIEIEASAEAVWEILVDGPGYERWNGTIVTLDGTIAGGEKIELVSTVDPSRTFGLRVRDVEPESSMKWKDGVPVLFRGVRTFTISENANGTVFTMVERLRGLALPMAAGSLPDFRPSFEQFAADLKAEVENS